MNNIKKFILFAMAILGISKNIESMNDNGANRQDVLTSFEHSPGFNIKVADYLVQLASIISLGNNNTNLIKGLATGRGIINVIHSIARILPCGGNGLIYMPGNIIKAFYMSDLSKIPHIGVSFVRGDNAFLDLEIFQSSKQVAFNSLKLKKDKSLKMKKIALALWLTANKISTTVIHIIIDAIKVYDKTARFGSIYSFLAEISELYRQRLMYSMIANKHKLA